MFTLDVLQWLMTSNNIILSTVLLMFIFGILFKLIRGN